MENEEEKRANEIALFRYGLNGDLLHLPKGKGSGLYALVQEKSEREYRVPFSTKTSLSAETIRSWLTRYRNSGFEALYPQKRSDAGKARRLPQEEVDLLCCIKEGQMDLTVKETIDEARKFPEIVPETLALPMSTVHRMHQTPHRGLGGTTPFDAWCQKGSHVKMPGPGLDLRELFLFTDKRKVQKDRTVSLNGTVYEVDAVLVGESVSIKHDPARPGDPVDIFVDGKRIQKAKVVDVYTNCRIKREHHTKALAADMAPDLPESSLKLRTMRKNKEKK